MLCNVLSWLFPKPTWSALLDMMVSGKAHMIEVCGHKITAQVDSSFKHEQQGSFGYSHSTATFLSCPRGLQSDQGRGCAESGQTPRSWGGQQEHLLVTDDFCYTVCSGEMAHAMLL